MQRTAQWVALALLVFVPALAAVPLPRLDAHREAAGLTVQVGAAVAFLASFGDGSMGGPLVRLSRDGGHRFEDPIHLLPGEAISTAQGSNLGAFASGVAPDGAFLFVAGHDTAEHRLGRLTVARLD